MSRPTSRGVSQVALKTNQGNPAALGVHQSLNVTARKPSSAVAAQGLADVLGVSAEILKPVLQEREAEAARQGTRDATLGKVDVERAARSASYGAGVRDVEVRSAVFNAKSAWAAHYAENVDKTLPADAVAQIYDEFMKEQLGDLMMADSKAAARMAPEYMKGMQDLVVAHQANLTKQHMVAAAAVMEQEIVEGARAGEPLKFFEAIDPMHKMTGDLPSSITAGIHAVGAEAMATGNPGLLDQIPRQLTDDAGNVTDNPDFTAEHRKLIDQYRLTADARRLDNEKVARGFAKMSIEREWTDRLNSGQTLSFEEILGQWEEGGLFTDDELMSWYGRSETLKRTLADAAVFDQFDGMNPNAPYYTQIGQVDQNGDVITEERARRQVDREVERRFEAFTEEFPDLPPEVVMARAAHLTVATEAFPYRPLQSTLENVPLDDPNRFANAAQAYAELPPEQRAKYVTSDVRRAQFEHVLSRVSAGDKPEEIMADLRAIDPKKAAERFNAQREDFGKEVGKIDGMLVHDAALFSTEFNVSVSDLDDPEYARARVRELMRIHMTHASATPEAARERAMADFLSTHMVVKSPRGTRMVPRVPGVTEKFSQALTWAEQNLAATAEEMGLVLPEGARLSLDPANLENSQFIVIDESGWPFRRDKLRFNPAELERLWRVANPEGGDHSARQQGSRAATTRAELMQRFREENPDHPMFNLKR